MKLTQDSPEWEEMNCEERQAAIEEGRVRIPRRPDLNARYYKALEKLHGPNWLQIMLDRALSGGD